LSYLEPNDLTRLKEVSSEGNLTVQEFRGDTALLARYCAFLDTPLIGEGIKIQYSGKTYLTYRSFLIDKFRIRQKQSMAGVNNWEDYDADVVHYFDDNDRYPDEGICLSYLILYGLVPGFAVHEDDMQIIKKYDGWFIDYPISAEDYTLYYADIDNSYAPTARVPRDSYQHFGYVNVQWSNDRVLSLKKIYTMLDYDKLSEVRWIERNEPYRLNAVYPISEGRLNYNYNSRLSYLVRENAERKLYIAALNTKLCMPGRPPLQPIALTRDWVANEGVKNYVRELIDEYQESMSLGADELLEELIKRKGWAVDDAWLYLNGAFRANVNKERIKELEDDDRVIDAIKTRGVLKQLSYFLERNESLQTLKLYKAREEEAERVKMGLTQEQYNRLLIMRFGRPFVQPGGAASGGGGAASGGGGAASSVGGASS